MITTKFCIRTAAGACAVALASFAHQGIAQQSTATGASQGGQANTKSEKGGSQEASRAMDHVNKSVQTVQQMKKDPEITKLLQQSKGVFILPDYGRVALGVGGQGGAGVLMVHQNGKWTGPGFYNFGGLSIGLQAGVSAGQIAFLLMNDKALNSFATNNKFALNADAGLTIVNYSARGTGSAGRGDIVAWSGTEGLFAGVDIGITDVNFDEKETHALYGKNVAPKDIISGKVNSAKASKLAQALP